MSDRLVHCLSCNQLFVMEGGEIVKPCSCVPAPKPIERWEGDDNIKLEMDPEPDHAEDGLSDIEADAMTLASAGMGTDEDYGYFGDGEDREGSWGDNG